MIEKPFVVLQGDNPYADRINNPEYFRGRFETKSEAVALCDEIFLSDFERIEDLIKDHSLSKDELESLLFVHYEWPYIEDHSGFIPSDVEYGYEAYCQHLVDFARRLYIPRFHRGDRVRFIGPMSVLGGHYPGFVESSDFLETGVYPNLPNEELITVCFDDGIFRNIPSQQLCKHSDSKSENSDAKSSALRCSLGYKLTMILRKKYVQK
jgi:hypothetical protein